MDISKTIYASKEYDVVYTPDIVYAHRATGDLTLQIVSPVSPNLPPPVDRKPTPIQLKFARWHQDDRRMPRPKPTAQPSFPLIVDCPGSGWAGADGHRHVPYLVSLAKAGFVAASISYRGTYRDDVVFPASVQDMKEAIRFLRANAEMFHIDKERVALLGDSSGGNTAAMAALTGDSPAVLGIPQLSFATGEHTEESMAVKACCCVYGPVDLVHVVQDRIAENKRLRPEEEPGLPFEAMEIWQETYKEEPERYMKAASPQYYIHSEQPPVPFLYVIGDDDPIIPVRQGVRFCSALRDAGGRAELVKVAGAGHGNGVWGSEMMDTVIRFFKAYL